MCPVPDMCDYCGKRTAKTRLRFCGETDFRPVYGVCNYCYTILTRTYRLGDLREDELHEWLMTAMERVIRPRMAMGRGANL